MDVDVDVVDDEALAAIWLVREDDRAAAAAATVMALSLRAFGVVLAVCVSDSVNSLGNPRYIVAPIPGATPTPPSVFDGTLLLRMVLLLVPKPMVMGIALLVGVDEMDVC